MAPTFANMADRIAADLSEPPDGQELQDAIDQWGDADDDEVRDEAEYYVHQEAKFLARTIKAYSANLQKLADRWKVERTRLRSRLREATDITTKRYVSLGETRQGIVCRRLKRQFYRAQKRDKQRILTKARRAGCQW